MGLLMHVLFGYCSSTDVSSQVITMRGGIHCSYSSTSPIVNKDINNHKLVHFCVSAEPKTWPPQSMWKWHKLLVFVHSTCLHVYWLICYWWDCHFASVLSYSLLFSLLGWAWNSSSLECVWNKAPVSWTGTTHCCVPVLVAISIPCSNSCTTDLPWSVDYK